MTKYQVMFIGACLITAGGVIAAAIEELAAATVRQGVGGGVIGPITMLIGVTITVWSLVKILRENKES